MFEIRQIQEKPMKKPEPIFLQIIIELDKLCKHCIIKLRERHEVSYRYV